MPPSLPPRRPQNRWHSWKQSCTTPRDDKQNVHEEYETTVEEPRAVNEELQNADEAYRSTLEELETSQAELQSINEALQTANQELQNKVEEVSQAYSDLQNLFAATEIATLFLDRNLCIQRYTPRAAMLFNLMPPDRGRPIGHLCNNLTYDQLEADARQVLASLAPMEREVQSEDGRWFLVRGHPFRTLEDHIDGVAITFVDITVRKRAEAALAAELASTQRLHQVSMRLLLENNLDQLLDEIMGTAIEIAGADMGDMQLLDPATGELHIRSQYGFEAPFLNFFERVNPETDSSCAAALRTGGRVVVPDILTSALFADKPALDVMVQANVRAVHSTPLVTRSGKVLGILSTHWRQPHAPDDHELRLLDLLARQAADLIERTRADAALREARESLKVALDAAHMGTWDFDLTTNQARTSLRHNQIFGYSEPVETWTPDAIQEQILPEDREKFRTAFAQALETGVLDVEVRVRWPDGSVHWIYDQGRVYFDEKGTPLRIAGVTVETTERKQAQLAEMRQRILQGQERERRHLARELHDGPVQDLAALTFDLVMLENELEHEHQRTHLAVIRARLQRNLSRLRHVIVTLRPPAVIDFGLAKAIEQHVEDLHQQQPDLVIETALDQDIPDLPEEVILALYRICQQALYNVMRHAQAEHAWVRLQLDAGQLVLAVEDDGVGFVVPNEWRELAQQRHLGIVGMVERTESIGGCLAVRSAPGRGTLVRVTVPLPTP